MEIYYTKIIESFIAVILFFAIRRVFHQLIKRTVASKVIQKSRSNLIRKAVSFINFLIFLAILMIIWGINQSQLVVFLGSMLTIVGVAFFAQWSLLSNITSSIILFFNHSVKIGDTISIMEAKDYQIEGKIVDIGLFFTKIKLNDTKDEIVLPNNIFINKTVRKVDHSTNEQQSNPIIDQEN